MRRVALLAVAAVFVLVVAFALRRKPAPKPWCKDFYYPSMSVPNYER